MVDLLVTLNVFYDFLSSLMQPLYWVVSGLVVFFHRVFTPLFGADNGWTWALAIVSLTVVIRTLLIPLFVKQINSARNMQLLQPKTAELQKKYGHDREKLGQETMKLYQSEGVNPMASCLPLLLQMPIFLALFRVLEGASSGNVRGHFFKENPHLVESLQHSEIFGGAGLADRMLPFFPFGSTQVVAIVLVILMVGVFWVTQVQLMRKNMPPESQVGQAAQMQKMMLYVFPVIYAMSAIVIPIGVLVYWLTSNVWTLAQQAILIRNNPAPNTPAYIDWEERMLKKGKDPQAIVHARAEKRRRNKKNPTATTSRTVKGSTATDAVETAPEATEETPKITRQQVTRQTVRTDEAGRRIVQRQQPRQSRAARKKK